MLKKIVIAIDGFSSTGKSTVAKQLAKHLGYIYVDTGAMYRAVTLFAMQSGLLTKDEHNMLGLIKLLPQIKLSFTYNKSLGFAEMYLNGVNVETDIRTMGVSSMVSYVAEVPEVRYKLVQEQRAMGEAKGLVMDGRDIGTVVFPEAELKLFMTASDEVRAQRRYKELLTKGSEVTFEEVLENIKQRDYIDTHRDDSPLVKAEDAVEIDNSTMSPEEQFERILSLVNRIVT